MIRYKRSGFILFNNKFKESKSALKTVMKKLKFHVTTIKIKEDRKLKLGTKLKWSISNDTNCTILFYLSDRLKNADTNLIEYFTAKRSRKLVNKPKLFVFYGENAPDDANDSPFFIPDERDILYVFVRGSQLEEGSYIEQFTKLLGTDCTKSVIKIHHEIQNLLVSRRNEFSYMHYFCSQNQMIMPNKGGVIEYLGTDYKKKHKGSKQIIHSPQPVTQEENEFLKEISDGDNLNMDELKEEFGNLENCERHLDSWKEDENKMKKFTYYLLTKAIADQTSLESREKAMNLLKTSLKTTFDHHQKDGTYYQQTLDVIYKAISSKTNISEEYLPVYLELLNWCIQCIPKNIDLSQINISFGNILLCIYGYVTSTMTAYKDYPDAKKNKYKAIIISIFKILSFLISPKYAVLFSVCYQFVSYINMNWDKDDSIKNNPICSIVFSFFDPVSMIKNGFRKFIDTTSSYLDPYHTIWKEEEMDSFKAYYRLGSQRIKSNEKKNICIIINNELYKNSNDENKKDIENIKEYFSHDYRIEELKDCTKNTLFASLTGINVSLTGNTLKILVVILSRGNQYFIKMVNDENVLKTDLMNQFSNNLCSKMKKKPKLFFFQTTIDKERVDDIPPKICLKFDKSDFFIGHGNAGKENCQSESYIGALLGCLKEKKKDEKIQDVCLRVNKNFNVQLEKKLRNSGYQQNASYEYCLWEDVVI